MGKGQGEESLEAMGQGDCRLGDHGVAGARYLDAVSAWDDDEAVVGEYTESLEGGVGKVLGDEMCEGG